MEGGASPIPPCKLARLAGTRRGTVRRCRKFFSMLSETPDPGAGFRRYSSDICRKGCLNPVHGHNLLGSSGQRHRADLTVCVVKVFEVKFADSDQVIRGLCGNSHQEA
jgi:hypothetical protein